MKQLVLLLLLLTACEDSITTYPPPPPATTAPPSQPKPRDAGNDTRTADAAPADAALDKDSDISFASEPPPDAQVTETTGEFSDAALDTDSGISTATTYASADVTVARDGGTESAAAPDSATPDAATDAGDAAVEAGPFVCPIPAALGSECDLVTSCGCADGFVCRTADMHTGQTLCFDAGITPPYAACGFDQDCGADSVCEGGLCRPLCDAPDTLCNDDSWCGKVSAAGRTVCLGNCNVLPLSVDKWNASPAWIELQALQFDRGLNPLPLKTVDYTNCGAGAYCHPGIDGTSPFPLCIAATSTSQLGESCSVHQDCATGLGCSDGECYVFAFVNGGCPDGKGSRAGLDTALIGAPDGYNDLLLCLPE